MCLSEDKFVLEINGTNYARPLLIKRNGNKYGTFSWRETLPNETLHSCNLAEDPVSDIERNVNPSRVNLL